MFYKILSRLLLTSDARTLGDELVSSNITGAEVVGRGTIVVDGKVIASSDEFRELKASAKRIIDKRHDARTKQNSGVVSQT